MHGIGVWLGGFWRGPVFPSAIQRLVRRLTERRKPMDSGPGRDANHSDA